MFWALILRSWVMILSRPVCRLMSEPGNLTEFCTAALRWFWPALGSVASNLVVDADKFMGVGLEVNANHLRPVHAGFVTGECRPIHLGGKTHVWDIRLVDDRGKLNCICRLTVAIVPKP